MLKTRVNWLNNVNLLLFLFFGARYKLFEKKGRDYNFMLGYMCKWSPTLNKWSPTLNNDEKNK